MKFLKKFLLWFIGIIALLVITLYVFDVDYLLRAVRVIYFNGHKTAFLDDYKYFDNRTIDNGTAQPWPVSDQYNKVPLSKKLESLHADIGTVAFLVIKNDSIVHESYYDGYDKDSKSNSFSVAKSIVSAALGMAIQEGKISSLDQLVSDYYPQFKEGKSATMTVGDLSSMASGLDWDENYYSPFSITTRAYFDEDLDEVILSQKGIDKPGQRYKYLSGNTQLLAMIIEKATGQKLSDYVSSKFWKPLGAENNALWQTDDEDGTVKAYCCIASNARDFARFGKLYKDFGKWNDTQLLDSTFVARSIKPRFPQSPEYGYGFWLGEFQNKDLFYMRGHLGQYVIVIPEDNLIVVRLGHRHIKSTDGSPHSNDYWTILQEVDKMKF